MADAHVMDECIGSTIDSLVVNMKGAVGEMVCVDLCLSSSNIHVEYHERLRIVVP